MTPIEVVGLIAQAVQAIGAAIAAGVRPPVILAAVKRLETDLATLQGDVDKVAQGE